MPSSHGLALSVFGHADTKVRSDFPGSSSLSLPSLPDPSDLFPSSARRRRAPFLSSLQFEFYNKASRDEAIEKITQTIESFAQLQAEAEAAHVAPPTSLEQSAGPQAPSSSKHLAEASVSSRSSSSPSYKASILAPQGGKFVREAPSNLSDRDLKCVHLVALTRVADSDPSSLPSFMPKMINLQPSDATELFPREERRRISPRHFCLLTIGSRGDVQPYIALALGLMEDGHHCTICTHPEFKEWVEENGIGHRPVGGARAFPPRPRLPSLELIVRPFAGSPTALMTLMQCVVCIC